MLTEVYGYKALRTAWAESPTMGSLTARDPRCGRKVGGRATGTGLMQSGHSIGSLHLSSSFNLHLFELGQTRLILIARHCLRGVRGLYKGWASPTLTVGVMMLGEIQLHGLFAWRVRVSGSSAKVS